MSGTGNNLGGHPFVPSESDVDEFYAAYVSMNGKHDRKTFGENVQVFFDLTFSAYIVGDGRRKEAFAAWRTHIGKLLEAKRYFAAVDQVHPYT